MLHSYTASMRDANRLMDLSGQTDFLQKLQKTFAVAMIDAAFAPLTVQVPKARKPRDAPVNTVVRGLGSTIKQVRAAQSRVPMPLTRSPVPEITPRIPAQAQYLTRKHRSVAGSRGYRLYLPVGRPNGLILMLHGCNQTPDDFALGTHMNALAEKYGIVLAYPEQTRRNSPACCWNWFKPGHQMRGMGEPAILASLTRKLMREFGLGRDRVFVAGLSAGGAMAAILADVYPDIFSAAGVHSGFARGAASGVVSAVSAMRSGGTSTGIAPVIASKSCPVRRIIFQGEDDRTVHPSNAAQIVAAEVGNDVTPDKVAKRTVRGRDYCKSDFTNCDGAVQIELWMIEGSGHAWSGGRAAGSYTDTKGPDASAQMIRFFMANSA
ncbi:extracellular catalytic domain type 1 short-chain-length polyhydroxyalkanoate depolymerase [Roseovarius nitratireducens]|uniref:extracellular catalytic domain type 1 short-chain-length polyhydroxyalkanoate depolymerase n=1 Tax=Roseovarius nitratireducens TaxID=2044597 RepID=UPI000CE1FD63|nr:PHB depolymerase family esterase [Roseovarius nitratireducens]